MRGGCEVVQGSHHHFADPTRYFLHSPGVAYTTRHPFGVGDHGCNLGFSSEIVEEALDRAGTRLETGPSRSRPLPPRRLLEMQLVVHETIVGDPLPAEEIGLELLRSFFGDQAKRSRARTGRRASTAALHERFVERTHGVLAEDPAARWSLADIGRRVAASPYHLARVFRERTGSSIHEARRRLRLAEAVDAILEAPSRRLDTIALECGFSSHGHLCTAFSRQLGLAPSDLRALDGPARRRLRDRLRRPTRDGA